jgi:hypothetical protein
MSIIKFLLDENVDPRLLKALRRRAPEMVVWPIGAPGTPALQTLDPEILIWCETHGFSLVTNNRTSMPVHLQDHLAAARHVPGIFILNPNMPMGQTVDELVLIWGASEPDEYYDLLHHLPLRR